MSFFLSSSGFLSSSYKHCCNGISKAEAPRLQPLFLLPSTRIGAIVLPQFRLADFKTKGSACPSSCRHPAFCRHPTSIVAIALPQHKHPDFSPCSFCHLQALVRLYFHSIGLQTSKKQRLHMSFFLSSSGRLSSSYKHCCNCTCAA